MSFHPPVLGPSHGGTGKTGRCRPVSPVCDPQQQVPQLSPHPQLLPQPQPQELPPQEPPQQQHSTMRMRMIHRQELLFPLLKHMSVTSL